MPRRRTNGALWRINQFAGIRPPNNGMNTTCSRAARRRWVRPAVSKDGMHEKWSSTGLDPLTAGIESPARSPRKTPDRRFSIPSLLNNKTLGSLQTAQRFISLNGHFDDSETLFAGVFSGLTSSLLMVSLGFSDLADGVCSCPEGDL
jgi:hypothetical protein